MAISADITQSWLDQHAELKGHQLPWLKKQRQQSIDHFEQVGLPSVRDEQWRYTNLRTLKNNVFELSTQLPHENVEVNLLPSNNSRLVFVDGYYSESLSTGAVQNENSKRTKGIFFDSFARVLKNCPERIEDYFGSTLPDEPHGFTALNGAFSQDGYVLVLDENAVSSSVLEIYFVSTVRQNAQTQNAQVSHLRNLIIAGANTQCSIVERHIGSDGSVYLNNTVTEIIAGDNSHIDHYKIQQESDEAFHIGGIFIKQSRNAQVSNHNIALGGLVTRNDVSADLLGEGGHIEMNGLVIGNGRQHVDNHTQVNHAVANCSSDEYYKTVLNDHARSVFRGRVIVAEDAQKTNAEQQNNNLLLSKHAQADTKPQLEIYADDVQCSHGATVGQLDQKSFFYLRSRGIDKTSAYRLLTFAFANEVIERIKLAPIRTELTELFAGQLFEELL